MNYYNLDLSRDLYDFVTDCEDAADECPQGSDFSRIDKDDNSRSPFYEFCFWRNNLVLWEYGYSVHLTDEAKNTFKAYTIIPQFDDHGETESVVFNINTKEYLSKKHRNILKFT